RRTDRHRGQSGMPHADPPALPRAGSFGGGRASGDLAGSITGGAMKIRVRDHVKAAADKMAKIGLSSTGRTQLDLYCVAPGQSQSPHRHEGEDKIYYVIEGSGRFSVGGAEERLEPGEALVAPPGVDHGLANDGSAPLAGRGGGAGAPRARRVARGPGGRRSRAGQRRQRAAAGARGGGPAAGPHEARGEVAAVAARVRASLMIPCLGDVFFPEVGVAMVRLLRRLGVELDFPEAQTCCGMPLFNSGYHHDAAEVAARTVKLFERAEHVVVPSGSCAWMVKAEYPGLLKHD